MFPDEGERPMTGAQFIYDVSIIYVPPRRNTSNAIPGPPGQTGVPANEGPVTFVTACPQGARSTSLPQNPNSVYTG